MYMKGLKRLHLSLCSATRRAKPITLEILRKLYLHLSLDTCGLREWRTIWRVHLAFFCLLRWDDVVRLKVFIIPFPVPAFSNS